MLGRRRSCLLSPAVICACRAALCSLRGLSSQECCVRLSSRCSPPWLLFLSPKGSWWCLRSVFCGLGNLWYAECSMKLVLSFLSNLPVRRAGWSRFPFETRCVAEWSARKCGRSFVYLCNFQIIRMILKASEFLTQSRHCLSLLCWLGGGTQTLRYFP